MTGVQTCALPIYIPIVRELFSKSYESDVLFTHRYIIDEIGEVDPYPLKILYLDIELDSNDIFPDMKHPNQPITCISLIDSFTNTPFTLFYENSNAKIKIESTENIKVLDRKSVV